MERVLSTTDKQSMVSSFLEIAVGQTADTARQFLQVSFTAKFLQLIALISFLFTFCFSVMLKAEYLGDLAVYYNKVVYNVWKLNFRFCSENRPQVGNSRKQFSFFMWVMKEGR